MKRKKEKFIEALYHYKMVDDKEHVLSKVIRMNPAIQHLAANDGVLCSRNWRSSLWSASLMPLILSLYACGFLCCV